MTVLRALPMKEAQAFWGDKVQLSPSQFAKLSAEAKLRAFAVSGIAKGSELNAVFNALQQALDEGITFVEFKKQTGEIFEKRGWTGHRAWRVNNIFRTNLQTAYNVGRYKQMKTVATQRPFWIYDAVNDSRTRPTHAALDGKVFPHDHPFWDTWYPLNGFRCRCTVRTLSARQVKAKGLKVETNDPTGRLIEPKDPVSGVKLPARLLMPDRGFKHHPGKAVWGGIVDSTDKSGKWLNLPGLKGPSDFRRPALSNVRPAQIGTLAVSQLLPKGKSADFYQKQFLALYGEEKVLHDAAGEPVILSLRSFLVDKAPGAKLQWKFSKDGHGEIIPLLQEMIEEPYEIWLMPQKNEDGKVRLTKRYISLWKSKDKKRIGGLAVFEVDNGVFQGVTAFAPMKKEKPDLRYLETQRSGLLLYKKGR